MRLSRLSTFPDLVSVFTATFSMLPSGNMQPVKPWIVCGRLFLGMVHLCQEIDGYVFTILLHQHCMMHVSPWHQSHRFFVDICMHLAARYGIRVSADYYIFVQLLLGGPMQGPWGILGLRWPHVFSRPLPRLILMDFGPQLYGFWITFGFPLVPL